MTTWAAQPRNWPMIEKQLGRAATEFAIGLAMQRLARKEGHVKRLPAFTVQTDRPSPLRDKIMAVMTTEGQTCPEIAKAAGVTRSATSSALAVLRAMGKVVHEQESPRCYLWRLP